MGQDPMKQRHIAAACLVGVVLTVAGCSDKPDATLSLPGPDGGNTVSEALAGVASSSWVRGFIVARVGEPVFLCEELSESRPPVCAGASLELRDGVLWREPVQETAVIGGVTDGALSADGAPCGYVSNGVCTDYPGVVASGDVLWTEVEYSVIGTLKDGGLGPLECPAGADC